MNNLLRSLSPRTTNIAVLITLIFEVCQEILVSGKIVSDPSIDTSTQCEIKKLVSQLVLGRSGQSPPLLSLRNVHQFLLLVSTEAGELLPEVSTQAATPPSRPSLQTSSQTSSSATNFIFIHSRAPIRSYALVK